MLRSLCILLISIGTSFEAVSCEPSHPKLEIEIYPTATTLPENLLRFYIYFPKAVGPVEVGRDIKLIDENGDTIEGTFLQNRYDLWTTDRRRLTLILNPGRVKTGLNSNERLGRALRNGARYSLFVSGQIKDTQGCRLGNDINWSFDVAPADLDKPSPESWDLRRPTVGTRDPLVLDLLAPHDHLSLAYRLRIKNSDGQNISGKIDLERNEQIWRFTPSQAWEDLDYELAIEEELEDLAGNRPAALFDQPMNQSELEWMTSLRFRPRGSD